ncbi:MAG: DinB family protein [Saprospiraceae bacterium]
MVKENGPLAESWIHVNDTERIFSYRALRISRGDQTPLPGFEQDDYVPFYSAKNRSAESIIEEFVTIRKASLSLLESLDAEGWNRTGTASNHKISVKAIAFILAGHAEHHLRITQEKYLAS